MAVVVKVQQIGEDLAIILPEEVLAHLKASAGDTLGFVMTPNGLLLTAYDAHFAEQMAAMNHVMDENREVLRKLAE
jgi:putative addiction module antidote